MCSIWQRRCSDMRHAWFYMACMVISGMHGFKWHAYGENHSISIQGLGEVNSVSAKNEEKNSKISDV